MNHSIEQIQNEIGYRKIINGNLNENFTYSPMNYIGGKKRLLSQIVPLFPKKIDKFIDLFAGGCSVGINTNANKIIFNDNLTMLVDMYEKMKFNDIDFILGHIEAQIDRFGLSKENEKGYKELRTFYNENKNPLDLFVLICFSFNHQIRFNNNHEYNNPFGRNRSSYNENIKKNLIKFKSVISKDNIFFLKKSFLDFDFNDLSHDDMVYCDPPYLITTGSYNDGKRGFEGWTKKHELDLLDRLDELNAQGVRFALSNVLEHNDLKNDVLISWIKLKKYKVAHLDICYSNSNYHKKDRSKKSSVEVLITNY